MDNFQRALDKLISIHVLRVEDDMSAHHRFRQPPISIHVLRVEDDHGSKRQRSHSLDFNPRPPCGGRPQQAVVYDWNVDISIHVLRVEDD